MRQNDLLKSDTGDHLRVLLYGDQQSYVVNCQRCKMPFPISTPSLLQMEKMPQDMYRLLALDEDISDRQRQQRDRRAELIAPLLAEECICDKSYRNRVLREIVSVNSVSRKTVLQYLWLYCPPKNPTPRNVLYQQTKKPSTGRSTNFITLHKSKVCRPLTK